MVKYKLDSVFNALSDPTRRDILQRLAAGELSVSHIAKAYNMSLVAVSKHLKVLEAARLIIKERRGRQQFVHLTASAFRDASEHLHYYEALLNSRLDALDSFLDKEVPTMATVHQKASATSEPAEQQELIMTHTFDAPIERVWAAYTDPTQIAKWWGPKGARLIACESNARPGGVWRFVLRSGDGKDYVFGGIFQKVDKPHQLVYTDGAGEPEGPRPEAMVTVTFEELPGGKTIMTKRTVASSAVHQLQAAWLKSAAGGGYE